MPRVSLGALAVFGLIAATVADAQFVSIPLGGPKAIKPSPNSALLGAPVDVAGSVALRNRPAAMTQFDAARHPVEVLAFLGLTRGARVLVIEADTGYYGEIIGTAIGESGHVTALVPPAQLKDPARRPVFSDLIGRAPGLSLVPDDAVRLASGSLDFVLLHLVYHGLRVKAADHGAGFIGTLFAALRPGGIVGVVDNAAAANGGIEGAASLGRIDPPVVETDFGQAGFILDSESTLLRNRADDRSTRVAEMDDPAVADRFILRLRKPD